MEKPRKAVKKPQQKPAVPTTRSSTRETIVQEKQVAKPKGKRTPDTMNVSEHIKKIYKIWKKKLEPDPNSNEEKTKLDDMSQFKVVSHNPSFDINSLCENIVTNAYFSGFTHGNFDKLGSDDKNKVEEAIYDIMDTFKYTPLEFSNSFPKSLYD